MTTRTVYVPFFNLSFNAGKLNPAGLVRAEGCVHGGASYLGAPPFFIPLAADQNFDFDETVDQPVIAHVNLAFRQESEDFTIFVYAGKKLYKINGSSAAGGWTVSNTAGTLTTAPIAQAANFVSFGPNEIFAAGSAEDVLICRDNQAAFEACFTSDDKPKADFVAVFGQRLLFGSIANTGSAGSPDPNYSLIWWGSTDNPRSIGNPLSLPKDLTDFQPLADDYGDITGLASGKESATIFKRSAIYQLEIGGDFGFRVRRIAVGVGCRYGHSITEFADDSYFWSTLGPAVVRDGQVLLLGDGVQPMRDMFNESPADPELEVLSAASDIENGLVMWLIKYQSLAYDYALDSGKLPTETEGSGITTYAVLAYNVISNQFTFLWKQQSADGIGMIDESSPGTDHSYIPLCLVDRVPWKSVLPLSGVGMIAVESAATGGEGTRNATLFLAGFPSSTFDPDWTLGQQVILGTGLIPLGPQNIVVKSVRPIFRMRRGKALPPFYVTLRTLLSPFEVERTFGPFAYSTNADRLRRGEIAFGGTADFSTASYFSVELSIDPRQTSPEAYAFLISEIEGVEIKVADAGAS